MGACCSSSSANKNDEKQEPIKIPRITPKQLVSWLDEPNNTQFQIIDVRDGDFGPQKIKGAINIPSDNIRKNVDETVQQFKDVNKIIFHCMFSQYRGPTSAQIYATRRSQAHKYRKYGPQEIMVLDGGYDGFSKQYRNYLEDV